MKQNILIQNVFYFLMTNVGIMYYSEYYKRTVHMIELKKYAWKMCFKICKKKCVISYSVFENICLYNLFCSLFPLSGEKKKIKT